MHSALSGWKQIRPESSALEGWMTVLKLKDQSEARNFFQVGDQLHLLADELEIVRDRLYFANATQSIYQPPLLRVEHAISPRWISVQAQQVQKYLNAEVLTALQFCSDLLPVEEESLSEEDFSGVVDLINQLELLLSENDFPSALTALIRKHIRLAELAIAQYPIRGAASLKDCVKFAIGDLMFEGDALRQTSEENASKIKSLWQGMNTLADGVIKADNLAQIGIRAVKFLSDLPG
jgi:hypothetical protein